LAAVLDMKRRLPISRTTPAQARRWARRLADRVKKVLADHPQADPDNVRHTLILLELPPFERLRRSLVRGSALSAETAFQAQITNGVKGRK
jgi:plasmid stabilization system protein ParE